MTVLLNDAVLLKKYTTNFAQKQLKQVVLIVYSVAPIVLPVAPIVLPVALIVLSVAPIVLASKTCVCM